MIDDNTIRRLAVEALNGFALTADAIATRIDDIGRLWHGDANVPAP